MNGHSVVSVNGEWSVLMVSGQCEWSLSGQCEW